MTSKQARRQERFDGWLRTYGLLILWNNGEFEQVDRDEYNRLFNIWWNGGPGHMMEQHLQDLANEFVPAR